MGNNRDKKLRSLLKMSMHAAPPHDLVAGVMKEIEMIEADRAHVHRLLKAVLQEQAIRVPPTDFTCKVMNAVKQPVSSYEPVITGKGWAWITFIAFICVVLAIVKSGPPVGEVQLIFSFSFAEFLNGLVQRFREPLFYVGIIGCSTTLLLIIDYLLIRSAKRTFRAPERV